MPKDTQTRNPRRLGPTHLLTVTTISALDGTLLLLVAAGTLETLTGAITTGLTVIAGGGAWVTARELYGGRPLRGRDRTTLGLIALVAIPLALGAVWVASRTGLTAGLQYLPHAAGFVLLLLAADITGLRLPRPAGAPLPALVVAGTAILEVFAHWTP